MRRDALPADGSGGKDAGLLAGLSLVWSDRRLRGLVVVTATYNFFLMGLPLHMNGDEGEMAAFVRGQYERYGEVIRSADIKIER